MNEVTHGFSIRFPRKDSCGLNEPSSENSYYLEYLSSEQPFVIRVLAERIPSSAQTSLGEIVDHQESSTISTFKKAYKNHRSLQKDHKRKTRINSPSNLTQSSIYYLRRSARDGGARAWAFQQRLSIAQPSGSRSARAGDCERRPHRLCRNMPEIRISKTRSMECTVRRVGKECPSTTKCR